MQHPQKDRVNISTTNPPQSPSGPQERHTWSYFPTLGEFFVVKPVFPAPGTKFLQDLSRKVIFMLQESVTYFTQKEEEFTNLLIEIGIKRNIAKVLVFLANTPEATSRAIERGTDLRQPDVSIALQYMEKKGWAMNRKSDVDGKGRPIMIYMLAKPISDIIDLIDEEKKKEANRQLQQIQKLRNYF